MTFSEMASELGRLDAMGAPRNAVELEERQKFALELHRIFGWMDASQWQSAISIVVERHTKGKYNINEFRAAVRSLRDRGVIERTACESCNGTLWAYVSLKLPDETMVTAVRPCSMCRPGTHWNSIKDTVTYPMEKSFAVQMAEMMTPRIAYGVLKNGSDMSIRFEPEAVAIMAEKAGAYEESVEAAKPKQEVFAQALGMVDQEPEPFI